MKTMRQLVQAFTETERQEKLILSRLRTIGIETIDQLRWATLDDLRESRAFGPLYLKKLNHMLVEIRGE